MSTEGKTEHIKRLILSAADTGGVSPQTSPAPIRKASLLKRAFLDTDTFRRSSEPTAVAADEFVDREGLVFAISLLKRFEVECKENNGTTNISLQEVDFLLDEFASAISPESSIYTLEAERNLRKNFESHSNIFDESVQSFITQNYSLKTEVSEILKAFRKRALVKRCIAAFNTYKQLSPDRLSPITSPTNKSNNSIDFVFDTFLMDEATTTAIKEELEKLSTWSFNLFKLADAAPNNVLVLVGCAVVDVHRLHSQYNIPFEVLRDFLLTVQSNYLENSYHNAEHAADVIQAMHYFFTFGGIGSKLAPTAKLAAIVAAAVHDVAHPGQSNNFLIATDHELAVRYSYRSPLENMHCAVAFQLLLMEGNNIFANMEKLEQNEVRNLMVDMILATDNAVHAIYLGKFESKVANSDSEGMGLHLNDPEDVRILLQIALHAADVSNPAKPFDIYANWTARIMEEFYAQGDQERERNLPVSVGMDRNNPIPEEKMQAGFIIGIVRPVFMALARAPKASLGECMQHLDSNLAYWQSFISKPKEEEMKKEIVYVESIEPRIPSLTTDE